MSYSFEKTLLETNLEGSLSSQTTRKLNLKYLVNTEKQPCSRLSAFFYFALFFFLGFLMILFWSLTLQNKKPVIYHKVVAGDTLRNLALHYYKNPEEWQKIFLANRKQLMSKDRLKKVSQNSLIPGEILSIPRVATVLAPKAPRRSK